MRLFHPIKHLGDTSAREPGAAIAFNRNIQQIRIIVFTTEALQLCIRSEISSSVALNSRFALVFFSSLGTSLRLFISRIPLSKKWF
jgi:hypothetical protein